MAVCSGIFSCLTTWTPPASVVAPVARKHMAHSAVQKEVSTLGNAASLITDAWSGFSAAGKVAGLRVFCLIRGA